ncbi:MAG: type II/IV secretion system protein [Chloroflexi bacterium]|nr:MAG: type II/IV secretion system protein [Chloroflexota bacterium]
MSSIFRRSEPPKQPRAGPTQPAPVAGLAAPTVDDRLVVRRGGKGKKIGEILIELGIVNADQLAVALKRQENDQRPLGQILLETGVVDDQSLAAVLSYQLDQPIVDLAKVRFDTDAIGKVPQDVAQRHHLIPVMLRDGRIHVAMADPGDRAALQEVANAAQLPAVGLLALRGDVDRAIQQQYDSLARMGEQVRAFTAATPQTYIPTRSAFEGIKEDAPVVQIVNLLVTQALRDRASDVHIEPQQDRVRLRFRVDGVLRDVAAIPPGLGPAIVSRIKVMANMNIVEKRRAQDGQVTMSLDDRDLDIRVATAETIWGEKVTLRLLERARSLLSLDALGMPPGVGEKYRVLVRQPYGMIVVTGPTGSGKTTTLYASLNEFDRAERNIMTIEDPVEYTFGDINQIQVNAQAGLSFETGLRAILRHDPDVILVGEVRDTETAQLAIHASLTGHLVLCSLHATDAIGALLRLQDLGVERFLIASGVSGIVSQRLVRKICPDCINVQEADIRTIDTLRRELGVEKHVLARGAGCSRCAGSGYFDRVGVFELLELTPGVKALLQDRATADQIRAQALSEGMRPMRLDALEKVSNDVTSLDEVQRNVFLA